MTEPLAETDAGLDPEGVDRVIDMARDVIALGPGLGQGSGTREFIRGIVDCAGMPWSSTPTASTRSPAIPIA